MNHVNLNWLSSLKLTLFVFGMTFLNGTVKAQAFGVKMSQMPEKYAGKSTKQKFSFAISVPNPNAEFESYMALSTPETGICRVSGVGVSYNNDKYGTTVKQKFEDFKIALSAKYGKSKDFDFIRAGALWDGAHEYGWSLYKKERNLTSFWAASNGSVNLGSIESIKLDARAVSPDVTFLTILYEFRNINKCLEIIKENNLDGL